MKKRALTWLYAGVAVFVLLPARALQAQTELPRDCASITVEPTRRFCNLVAEAIDMAQPRVGLALTGGNPLPGAASTLGMRIGKVPRVSVAGRLTAVHIELPPIQGLGSASDIGAFLPSVNVDAAIGIFDGVSLFPTVGGFASLDLVGSLGLLFVPGDDGFNDESRASWAVGARVGLLRESFTAPGISITGLYRRIDDFAWGDRQLVSEDSYFDASSLNVLSLRGIVGKRLFVIGAMAGVGYDRYSSDIDFGVENPGVVGPARFDFSASGYRNSRTTLFGSLQWTMLVLSIVGEGGWQFGGSASGAALPAGRSSSSQNGTYYGSLAVRLAM